MNGDGTMKDSCAVAVPPLHYHLDCALRNERDETRRMQLALRMGMEREGSTPAFKARQDAILNYKPRVRVRAITA
jgi:hypothetical protein